MTPDLTTELKALIERGLTYGQAHQVFADAQDDRARQIIELAGNGEDGEVEIDGSAIVSEGDDNGAYVSAWVWVSFANTPLDKEVTIIDMETTPIGKKLTAAGFAISNTGGNVMAWAREFAEDGAIAYVGQGDGELGENGDETSWGCSISDKDGNHYEEFEIGGVTLDYIIAHVASAEAQLKAALRVS